LMQYAGVVTYKCGPVAECRLREERKERELTPSSPGLLEPSLCAGDGRVPRPCSSAA
jgi:hypothetical protein